MSTGKRERRAVALDDVGAHLRRIVIVCAAAFGTSEPMLISSTRIVQPQAMMLIIFSLIILSVITLALVILAFIFLSPMAALIAMSPFAAAARSPL
jgi:hypothetical protein